MARPFEAIFVQALYKRSVGKISIRALCTKRSPKKLSVQDLLDHQNEHCATTRAIWHAQSADRVVRAIWKWAPRHNESDLTGPKCREGCASDFKISTAHSDSKLTGPKWREGCASHLKMSTAPRERSDTHKAMKGLREHIIEKSKATFYPGLTMSTKYCACHTKWARRIQSAAPATQNHHHVRNQIRQRFHKIFDRLKCRPSSPNTAHATKNSTSQFEQRTEKCHACCADEKVSDVLRLSRQTMFQTSKCPESATPATQNGHSSKNGDDALVKRGLRKRGLRDPVCARMRSRNAHGHLARELLCCKGHRIAGDHLEWTPGLNTYRENPAVGPHCWGIE